MHDERPGLTKTSPRDTAEEPLQDRLNWRKLDDLAPQYVPEMHSVYLRALLEGIESHNAANIALSGPYGAGKSSILQGLLQRYPLQSIEISLSTVRAASPEKEAAKRSAVTANDLQKEIVKQILYVVDPARTPASRFPRTSRFQWSRGAVWALIAGLAGVAVQWVITLIVAFAQQDASLSWRPELYVPTFLSVALVALLLLRLTNGRLVISDLTAGPAKLTLSDSSVSYFDDYLDEIVYFFQVAKKRIVVLEDMDRFDNIEVFEDLRALNVLLNRAAQLQPTRVNPRNNWFNRLVGRRPTEQTAALRLDDIASYATIPEGFHDGPIVFVYAIRDSLLAQSVEVANDVHHDAFARTKFFDLIVPVVPFVTQQNARGALRKELGILQGLGAGNPTREAARISDSLVREIARYFPDQRQIRNIRNEYAIYRDRLLQPGSHPEELTADRLLALVVYKNFEIADFELIRLGTSKLHTLHRLGIALVDENLARIGTRLSHPSDEAQKSEAEALAQRLVARTSSLGVSLQIQRRRGGYVEFDSLSRDDLGDLELWRGVVSGGRALYINSRPLDRAAIEAGFGVSLAFAESLPLPSDERASLERDRDELESMTWTKLWENPQFTLSTGSAAWEGVKKKPDAPLSFGQIVEHVIGEGLVADLVAAGHLTQNFALLSAHFDPDFLSIEAQNFVTSIMEKPGRRHLAPISRSAIGEVLAEGSLYILERSGMVNIHVLEYLLLDRPDAARRIVAQLRSWTHDDQTFVRDFCSRYAETAPIESLADTFGYLASLVPESIAFIAVDPSIPDSRRVLLFDAAIGAVSAGEFPSDVSSNETVRSYAQHVHSSLSTLTRSDEQGLSAARCLARLGVTVNDLTPLSAAVRTAVVEQGGFKITMPNLRVVVGDGPQSWVSLERLRSHPAAYRAVINRIDEYLAIDPAEETTAGSSESVTAASDTALVAILTDLQENKHVEPATLLTVTLRADPSIRVGSFAGAPESVQEALLRGGRALISTEVLDTRITSHGSATLGVATALNTNPRPHISDERDLSNLAGAVLQATNTHPALLTAEVVSDFLDHIRGQFQPDPVTLLSAAPAVALRLVAGGWSGIEHLRLAATPALDWKIREALLAGAPAPEFAWMQQILRPADVQALLTSQLIPIEVKSYVSSLLDTLLVGDHAQRNADAIARFLREKEIGVTLESIHLLARAGAQRPPLLVLLSLDAARADFESSPTATLQMLGGPYASLTHREEKHPPTFPPTVEHRQLLDTLARVGYLRLRKPAPDGALRVTRLAEA